ncbi:MAG: TonB-dependent receptor [Pseudomonadota bacterium]|nr:TonB-dependent receptor [Pseudomonadota bacterium]
MSIFKPSMLTLAMVAAGVGSANLYAADNQNNDKEQEKEVEVIEVTGFRASLVKAINTKRFSPEVVESVSAEDIGKLPDSSIAESIARLPGLAAQRLDGRASRVTIRGFGEDHVGTTFNGREQVSITDNRGAELDLYPSEIMSAVTVYKTPSADLEASGLAGVIDLQTIKPLSMDERVIKVNAMYEQTGFEKLNPDADDNGFRGTLSYIDQFADNTLGVAVAFNTMSSPNQEKRWNSWGYPEFTGDDGNTYSILGGAKPFVRSSTLERDSVMAVIEYAPSENLRMVFDSLYVDFVDEKILRGIEVPFAWGQGSISADNAVVDPATGFVTSAITEGQRVVVRNDYEDRSAELTSFGFNLEYDLSDSWSLEFDASHSSVEREIWSMESYAGTGRGDARGVADNLGYAFNSGNTGATFSHELDYSDYNLIQLGGPLSWGWSSALNEKYGVVGTEYENQLQDGFLNTPEVDDELNALRLAATKVIENDYVTSVEFGLSYSEREKTKRSEGYFLTVSSFSLDNPGMMMVPEEYRLGTANLDFIGMGDMIAFNSRAMVEDGYYDLLAESLTDPSHATKSWTVKEQLTSAFVKANIDTEVAGMPLTGNAGLRYVKTEQESQGNAFNTQDGKVITSPTHIEHDYAHLLPSLNLSLSIDDEQSVRFGAAKTISRARMDEMNASVNATYNQQPDENGSNWVVNGGNPSLEPYQAINFDLSYENYFSPEGYFAIALYHKDLKDWIFDGSYSIDMTGVADPSTGLVPANPDGTGNGKVNGGDGTVKGAEFSVTLPFNYFADALDGFGLIASHTVNSSDMVDQDGNDYEIPGLSKSIQNLTFYYENYGFQARASMRKRDDFKGDVYGRGFDSQQVDIQGETIWDAQIGYDFSESGLKSLEGMTVTFQVQNITEEPFISLSGDNALQVRDYQDYGRTFLLGVNYQF